MGGFLDKPVTEKSSEMGQGNGIRYCVSWMQGWRTEMEDTHSTVCSLPKPNEQCSFFGVFDGHAGKNVSASCAEKLLETIRQTDEFSKLQIEEAISNGFLKFDEELRSSGTKSGGSTATCVFFSPEHMYFANLGDSRAVLCQNGSVVFNTFDHKPYEHSERIRIEMAGGNVMIKRVNGILAVSRALGDFDFKMDVNRNPCDQVVSPAPDITVLDRLGSEEFVVLACDGIWDVMSSEDVVAYIYSRLLVTEDLTAIVNSLLDICLWKGSRDNMSLMLLLLPDCPRVTREAVANDAKLDRDIARFARESMEKHDIFDFEMLVNVMKRRAHTIPNLPPGAGIFAKFHIIEKVYKEVFPQDPSDISDYFSI